MNYDWLDANQFAQNARMVPFRHGYRPYDGPSFAQGLQIGPYVGTPWIPMIHFI